MKTCILNSKMLLLEGDCMNEVDLVSEKTMKSLEYQEYNADILISYSRTIVISFHILHKKHVPYICSIYQIKT